MSFSTLLRDLVAREPGRPLVTSYDHATGERVELSTTTYANWVAKVSSLLVDELELERGDRLLVDLPAHWLTPVALGAAWTTGLVVVAPGATPGGAHPHDDQLDAVVCGPGTLAAWAGRAQELVVVACALRPLGVRFADPVPAGVHDLGVEVWSQPDAFTPWDPPAGDDPALVRAGAPTTHDDLWAAAGASGLLDDGDRVGTQAGALDPLLWAGVVARGGSLVLQAHADAATASRTCDAERVTRTTG